MITITTADGLPNDGASPPRTNLQPAIPVQVAILVYFVTFQVLRDTKATNTTLKFACTPGRVNRKIIDCETKAGAALYKRAKILLYSNIGVKFALTSEVLLPFVGLLTGNAKSCGWDNFDVPIATTGSMK